MNDVGARVAVITGASSGMGEASARTLAAAGWRVRLLDVHPDVEKVADDIGDPAEATLCDVSRQDQIDESIRSTAEGWGRIDALVCCAGIEGHATRVQEIAEEDFDQVFAVNLKGFLFPLQAVVPRMLESGGGSIVAVASTSAIRGIPRLGAYSASKGAVLSLVRSAAVELAGKGIRVNAISPGTIRTRMFEQSDNFDPEVLASTGAGAPMKRVGESREIADAVKFLVSNDSSYVTGQNLVVDGGLTSR